MGGTPFGRQDFSVLSLPPPLVLSPLFSSLVRLSLVSRVLLLSSRVLSLVSRLSRVLSLVSRVVSLVSRFGLLFWVYDVCLWCMIYVYVNFSFLEWVSKKSYKKKSY